VNGLDTIVIYQKVSQLALALPDVEAGSSYGTPAFKIHKKLMARFKKDGKTLMVRTTEREKWMRKDPVTFFITEHYRNYPAMLIDLERVNNKDLRELLQQAWELQVPKKLLKNYP
jgi:hypothetical protein